MKQLQSITISGTLRGTIWMPCAECTKDVSAKFTPKQQPFSHEWTGIRDALLRLTNDGDFQSCTLESVTMSVVWRSGKDIVTRHAGLPVGKETEDLYTPF